MQIVGVKDDNAFAEHLLNVPEHLLADLADIHLAVGYDGIPLRAGHGAPARLVVPGRRGPEWVKWVTRIDTDHRPAWLQPPLPLS